MKSTTLVKINNNQYSLLYPKGSKKRFQFTICFGKIL